MSLTFIPGINRPEKASPALWFLFKGYRLLIQHQDGQVRIPTLESPEEIGLTASHPHYLGQLQGSGATVHCFCGEIGEDMEPPSGFTFESLRPLYSQLDEQTFWLAGRAVQIVDWDRTHQYCGRCGQKTVDHQHERSKVCPNCGLTNYPRLSPAIIVRVQRTGSSGPEILLARATRFPNALFSVLAGFVEPGETLEDCVQREVYEETRITVKNIAYFGSQPWPFPHSLMIAFTADYESGQLQIDPLEIAEAGWYPATSMPAIPPPPSIANQLITTWLENVQRIT